MECRNIDLFGLVLCNNLPLRAYKCTVLHCFSCMQYFTKIYISQGLAGSESSSETGLNRPITEDDSLQISGRGGGLSFGPHCFDPIAEAPENIPKVRLLKVHLNAE